MCIQNCRVLTAMLLVFFNRSTLCLISYYRLFLQYNDIMFCFRLTLKSRWLLELQSRMLFYKRLQLAMQLGLYLIGNPFSGSFGVMIYNSLGFSSCYVPCTTLDLVWTTWCNFSCFLSLWIEIGLKLKICLYAMALQGWKLLSLSLIGWSENCLPWAFMFCLITLTFRKEYMKYTSK